MTDRSTDIDFDFFDEPATEEAPARVRSDGRSRGPLRPPGGVTPLLRLIGLIAFAITVVVVLVFAVQACRSENHRAQYVEYMDDVRALAGRSQQVGRQLDTALTTPGTSQEDLHTRLGELVRQQEQDVTRARELAPPGRLRGQHRQLIEALEFRLTGLQRLQGVFGPEPDVAGPAAAGRLLATQMRRFVASDVVWEDGFRRGSMHVLASQDVTGVEVPGSRFLRNHELATARAMQPIWERVSTGAAANQSGGIRGHHLVSVRALPQGIELSADSENRVTASTDLSFQVTIENSGDSQENNVEVRLVIEQEPRPVERSETIDVVQPGQRRTVTFGNVSQGVQFAEAVPVRVEVVPVEGERNVENNRATYPVVFSLG
jgi:hypothetical protein